ncbi:putative reverse transcriptase domain-containing protein [Tanacetum coccineum]
MSSATSAVTYTSVYTDSEPGRAFWGADDEEISEGGIPRVIVLGYDGLPMQPVAPPSPDYIPGPEDPQTPPVPQDEDEREPMFVQAHDPDYVPEPIYPEYIPLEDEHEFPAEEQPLPPVDSPTAESPGYVTESDPEEDPEEYEDDETEDGPVDYPMDGGDDGDDDDGDSSGWSAIASLIFFGSIVLMVNAYMHTSKSISSVKEIREVCSSDVVTTGGASCVSTMIEDVEVALDMRQTGEEAAMSEMEIVYKLESRPPVSKSSPSYTAEDWVNQRVVTCFECGVHEHYKKDCPKLKNQNHGNQDGNGGAQERTYAVGNVGKNLDANVVTGTFLLNNRYASILFDIGADRSFVSTAFSFLIDIVPFTLDHDYDVELADEKIIGVNTIIRGCT